MKNRINQSILFAQSVQKIFITMKCSLLIILLSVISLNAETVLSQSISIHLHDASLREVLKEIEKEGGISFLFDDDLKELNAPVSVSATEQTPSSVLHIALEQAGMMYEEIAENFFVLLPKTDYQENPQDLTINGIVTDAETGETLPGASIFIKGTTLGTASDADGNYTIDVEPGQTLVFSYVGMITQEVLIEDQTLINVALESDVVGIEGVVVTIGYGQVQKTDLTGSISTVIGSDIAQQRGTSLAQDLQGLSSGIMVNRSGSLPGASAQIRIRGITTIGDSDPLVVVDGVPVDNINDVNPNDIDHVTFLKDAASASIYGSRAAAGVILITTKQGEPGETFFDFSTSVGFEVPTQWPDQVGTIRYLEMLNEITWNDSGNPEGAEHPIYSKDEIENWMELNRTHPNDYPVTDWRGLLINDYAPRQRHQLTFNHGGNNINTRASIRYENTDALFDHRNYERVMSRINNTITFNDFLQGGIAFAYNHSTSNRPQVNPIRHSHQYAPIYSAKFVDGRISGGKDGSNMYAALHHGGFINSENNKFDGQLSLTFSPLDGFSLTGVFAPTIHSFRTKNFRKAIPYSEADDPSILAGHIFGFTQTDLSEQRMDRKSFTSQLFANYQTTLSENHSLNLMVGYEGYEWSQEVVNARSANLALSDFPYLDVGNIDNMLATGGLVEHAYSSFFGRIMYDYAKRYFLQANFRVDGSSRFHSDYRWGFFPSVSMGWIISEETFLQNADFLSMLKLRGSYGTLGNERIGHYPYQASMNFSNALFWRGDDIVSRMTAAQINYAVSNISWETTEVWDVGFDTYLFEDRLSFTGDYYYKQTRDMLLNLEIPIYIGYENPDQNAGVMWTRGWDIEMGWRDKLGDLEYNIRFNLSDFRSVMGDMQGTVFYGDQIIEEGAQFNAWYGYLSDGLFQHQVDVDESPVLHSAVRPGDIRYLDVSGPDGTPDGRISPEHDKVILGGSLPRYMYGGSLSLRYNNIGLFLSFQGVGKQNSRITPGMIQPFLGGWTSPSALLEDNYWSHYNTPEENRNAQYPRLSHIAADNNNYVMSDYWLINGAYFRIKSFTVSYNLPHSIANTLHIRDATLFATVTDPFSLHNFPPGWDPEATTNSYITSTINFGIDIKF